MDFQYAQRGIVVSFKAGAQPLEQFALPQGKSFIQFKNRHVESGYLFPVRRSGGCLQVSNFETNFKHYLRRANLNEDISPHCLRNNFAKRCLMSGMDIYTLSKILGNSSVTVTEQAYLDLTDEDIGKRYQHYSPVARM